MIRTIKINNTDVWLYIQRLAIYEKNNGLMQLNEKEEYLCYMKLSPPTEIILGELIRDEQKKPKLFNTPEDAEIYAIKFFNSAIKH